MNKIKAVAFYNISSDISEVHHMLGKFIKPVEDGIYSKLNSKLIISASDIAPRFCSKPEKYVAMTGYIDGVESIIDLTQDTDYVNVTTKGFIDWCSVINRLSTYDKIYCPRINEFKVIDVNRYELHVQNSVPWFVAEKIVIEFIKWFIDYRCQWSRASFERVYNFFNKDNPQVCNLELEDELLHACRETINNLLGFIGDDDWCVYTVTKRGSDKILIEKGEDYRITDWMSKHAKSGN